MVVRDSNDFGCERLTAEVTNDDAGESSTYLASEAEHGRERPDVVAPVTSPMEIDTQSRAMIARLVPGGADNIQDAYSLTPLQEGLLFHHLTNQRAGTYVLSQVLEVDSRSRLDSLIEALQAVVDRNDVLRIAVCWEDMPSPVQVVCRTAPLQVEEFTLRRGDDIDAQLAAQVDLQRQTWDLQRAPAVRLHVARHPEGAKWYAILHVHHVICDYGSLRSFVSETVAHMRRGIESLPRPIAYRQHVELALANAREQEGSEFFRTKLHDVVEPGVPFSVALDAQENARIEEARQVLRSELSERIRVVTRRLGFTAARLFHAAWGIVLAHACGREDVVFGTVLLANWQRRARSSRILGLSVNTLPLRLRLSAATARELVEQTDRELTELLAYEQVPLVVAQRCSSLPVSTPLFSALLNFRHVPYQPEAEWQGVEGIKLLAAPEARTNYPLALIVDDLQDAFVLIAQADERIGANRVLAYMEMAVESLVVALECAPDTPALDLKVLPDSERKKVVELFNARSSTRSVPKLIHELFESQVERTPDALAVTYESESLTYAELNRRANKLARYLRDSGIEADELVAICIERSLGMVIALLGILKAGGAYVPLDPSYPIDRQMYVMRDSSARVLVTQTSLASRFSNGQIKVVVLDEIWNRIEGGDASNLDPRALGLKPDNLAYVIYTSGSTGQPKGVMIEHRNVSRLFSETNQWFSFGNSDVWTLFHSFAFDFSVWELWGALLYGGRVVVVPQNIARSPREFYKLLCEQRVTVLNQTPSAFVQLIDAQAQSSGDSHALRLVIFGGEALEPSKLRPWVEKNGIDNPQLVNMYGITETTVHVTYRKLTADEIAGGQGSPIGVSIPDLQLYLLDRRQQVVPIGVPGEIYVGGGGVARGYLGRPDLNSQRFIADGFRPELRGRLYRSGDLGRWKSDGSLEYLGRNDQQVKIRGFRIELGEIESQLAHHERLKESAVVAREDASGDKKLVAYVVPKQPELTPSPEHLREFLTGLLPEYMIPNAFVVLERLPLTSNGKLDRKALPQPRREAYASLQYEEPLGEVERGLAEVWTDLLKVERVSRRDSFFDLGGHSLLVLNLVYRVRKSFSASLRVADIYRYPTLEELSRRIDGREVGDHLVNLSQEADLDDRIRAISGIRHAPPKAVLVTGATGFVGRFILAHLLQATNATVYCLVRSTSREQAATRLKTTLVKWDLWKDKYERRVIAIPSDLRLARLGIDSVSYAAIENEVDTIYHCATSMNHLETYAMAKPTNVRANWDLLKIATQSKPKLVNYVSTMSVFSNDGTNRTRIVNERSLIEHERHAESQGYAASKWVGEKIFMIANERGIPCNIFRVGLVWADAQRGRYDELQREYRVLKSALLSGCGVENYQFMLPPTPVDYVVQSIASLADRHQNGGGIFHISAVRQAGGGLFEDLNKLLPVPLELKPLSGWIDHLRGLHGEGYSLPVMPLIEAAFSRDETSLYRVSNGAAERLTHMDCSMTHRELERCGIFAPEFNEEILRVCLEDMLTRDRELRQMREEYPRVIAAPLPSRTIGLDRQ